MNTVLIENNLKEKLTSINLCILYQMHSSWRFYFLHSILAYGHKDSGVFVVMVFDSVVKVLKCSF